METYYLKKPQQDLLKEIFETVNSINEQKVQLLSNTLKKYGINVACDPFQKKDGIDKSEFDEFMRIADRSMNASKAEHDIVVFSQEMKPIPSLVKRIMANDQCAEILKDVRAYSQRAARSSYDSIGSISTCSSGSMDAFEPTGPRSALNSEQSLDSLSSEEDRTWFSFFGNSLSSAFHGTVDFIHTVYSLPYEGGLYHIKTD